MSERRLFGTDGVRGKANVFPMTGEVAFVLGRAVTSYFQQNFHKKPLIIIGKDTRLSCYMLEHVPDPAAVVKACSQLVKPGGWVFFSTLNRSPKSFLFAIVGAEYVLNLLPKGTHEYARLIKPSELADWVRAGELELAQMKGMTYNPFTRVYAMNSDTDVNYLMATQKPMAN